MRVEDIDLIINERKQSNIERDLAVLSAGNHSCHRSTDSPLYRPFSPIVLRLGMDGFREEINKKIGVVVSKSQENALTQVTLSSGPPAGASSAEAWANLSSWRGVAVKASRPAATSRASPVLCDHYDHHHRLPGNPDHVAKALLAYLASGNARDNCCDSPLYMKLCRRRNHMCAC